MTARGARRFIADLLRGRRPRPFRARETDVDELRAAIMLRAARPSEQAPSEEFVTDLHRRLATELVTGQTDQDAQVLPLPGPRVDGTRRRLVAATSIAAAAAAVGAATDHALSTRSPAQAGSGGEQTLIPNTGEWRTVSASAQLPEGGAQSFDLGTVVGFVSRTDGELRAVSGVCTHLGCRLALDAAAKRLNCPCHTTSFALGGQLLRYQLAVPPAALPRLEVRETQGMVQVFAPPGPVA
ncbi:MAG: ubiquinol-cytochrome c reductase iron-sulfur subunit [Pseudonocardiaceae bacterium]